MTGIENRQSELLSLLQEAGCLLQEKRRRLFRRVIEEYEIAQVFAHEDLWSLSHKAADFPHGFMADVMLSREQIINGAFPHEPVAGVYFLIRDGDIAYVGQSNNVFDRSFSHERADAWSFIRCRPDQLDALESLYIHALRPRDNARKADGSMHAPMTLDALGRLGVAPDEALIDE